jgi:hypothetical protein
MFLVMGFKKEQVSLAVAWRTDHNNRCAAKFSVMLLKFLTNMVLHDGKKKKGSAE